MIRFAPIAAAALCLATAISPASAQSGYYTAVPAEAAKKDSFITQTTVWKCVDGTCVAPKATMSDKVMCERVAKQIGKLNSFTVAGTAFEADALTACNARAK